MLIENHVGKHGVLTCSVSCPAHMKPSYSQHKLLPPHGRSPQLCSCSAQAGPSMPWRWEKKHFPHPSGAMSPPLSWWQHGEEWVRMEHDLWCCPCLETPGLGKISRQEGKALGEIRGFDDVSHQRSKGSGSQRFVPRCKRLVGSWQLAWAQVVGTEEFQRQYALAFFTACC